MRNLCNECARKNGLIPSFDTSSTNLTGSNYQLGKFLDHTQTGSRSGGTVSIFNDPGYEQYKNTFFSTLHSGSYHQDANGRESLKFVLSADCGFAWDDLNKQQLYSEDAIRLVCFRDSSKVHHYSQDSSMFQPVSCDNCGETIL